MARVSASEAPREEREEGTGICFGHGAPCPWGFWEIRIWASGCPHPSACRPNAIRLGFRGRTPALLSGALRARRCWILKYKGKLWVFWHTGRVLLYPRLVNLRYLLCKA